MAGRKIFVGSLPSDISEAALRAEFSKYGMIEEVFVKQGCEIGRQWAFVTFATTDQAIVAKEACDRILMFPGAERPCDVMLAKNQGMFGQQNDAPGGMGMSQGYGMQPVAAGNQAKKIFVGSLPDGMTEAPLRAEFSKYGMIEDVFLKQGCESGRQWAFLTFSTHEQASHAVDMTNGILQFPGSFRACEVTLARNQGLFGQDPLGSGMQPAPASPVVSNAPKKIFVGSLPDGIQEPMLRAEFCKYGQITDVFIKQGCEPGRQWGFITFVSPDQAQLAKEACDRILMFPGSERPCEVTMARHQGLFGQDPVDSRGQIVAAQYSAPQYAPAPVVEGPRKVFVGSLPDTISEAMLRAEFSKYGQIVDFFLKTAAEPGRHWSFITFATPEQAQYAKEATDRVLLFPGAEKPCEVMLAKNQGKFGQNPMGNSGGGYQQHQPQQHQPQHQQPSSYMQPSHSQPPPPATPPPPHLTTWRMYKTAAGLPYYHNSATGVTQWECPPELQAAQSAGGYNGVSGGVASQRYSPY